MDMQRIKSDMAVELEEYRKARGDIAVQHEKLAVELQRLDAMIAGLENAIGVVNATGH
jgi:hypothetical protein